MSSQLAATRIPRGVRELCEGSAVPEEARSAFFPGDQRGQAVSGTRVEGQDRQACESRDLLGNVGCWHIRSDCCSRVRANDAAINSRLFQHFGSLLFFVRINRCKFKGRPSSNFKESILVLEALFTIAFRNVQWN
jgi:hypothetical protein